MSSSIHDNLERVRKPRVHIRYDVETNGARIKVDLPFVVGVMGDFSGDPTKPLQDLEDRKFVQVDRDNFNDVMKRMTPGLQAMKVKNTLADDGSEIAVDLKFESLDDFEPAKVADQVPALKKLLQTRGKLKELLTKVDRSNELEKLLEDVLKNTDELKKLSSELGVQDEAEEPHSEEPEQPSE